MKSSETISFKKKGVYIVAELSANHNHSLENIFATIAAFAEAGADAVKVQTYKPESLCLNSDNEYFGPRTSGLWKGKSLWELYSEGALPYHWHADIQAFCHQKGVDFFSTPFDLEGVHFLAELNVPVFKIASFEINDLPLIKAAAQYGKPMIMSTGVATVADIEAAIDTCLSVGNSNITLLKCTSQYPAPIEAANLRTIADMRKRFGVAVGLSDHTMGHLVPMLATALGVCLIEKHVVLDRNLNTPDASFSMLPNEFRDMVDAVRSVELALGDVSYEVSQENLLRRRSLFFVTDKKAGDKLYAEDARSIRPGHGLPPSALEEIVGKKLNKDVVRGEPVTREHFND